MSGYLNADNFTASAQPEVAPEVSPPSPDERMAFVKNLMSGGEASNQNEVVTEPPAASVDGIQQATPEPEPTPPAAPESRLEVPDKFKDDNGNIRPEFVKSYLHMEAMYAKQARETNELRQMTTGLQEQIAQLQAQPGSPNEQPVDDASFDAEAFREKFYDDPVQALAEWDAKRDRERQEQAATQQREYNGKVAYWNSEIQRCESIYPDFQAMLPVMQEIIAANREGLEGMPNAIEAVYWAAKGIASAQAAPVQPVQPSVAELLQSEEIMAQIAANPEVQKAILSQHAQGVLANQAPVLIGNQPGSAAPAAAPVEIKSTKDAMKASMSLFKKAFGGA